jgi:hypothetical protein
MDGLLSPEDQAALGEKVQASGVAPALVERVRDVIARRTLSAPPPAGRGLADDPNTAAEFLDNALTADRLEAFERVCVESDIHLADVAACHQLLAELAREPGAIEPVPAADRRRLLETVSSRLDPLAAMEVAGSGRRLTRAGRAKLASPARPQGRRAPLAAWVSVAAAVALLGVLAGFFLWSVNRGTKRTVSPEEVAVAPAEAMQKPAEVAPAEPPRAPAVEPPADEAEATAAVEPVAPARGDEPVQEGPPAPSVVAARAPIAPVDGLPGTPAAEPSPPELAASEPPPPAATVPPDTAAAPPPGDQRVPSGDALAIVAAPAAAEPALAAASIPAAAADAPPADGAAGQGIGSAAKVRDGGLLLHRGEVDGAAAWLLVPTDAPLTDREDLLAPPWCHPVFSLGGITIRLEPGSRVVVTHDADGTPRVEVVFGRAIVSGEAADARVGVMAGGLHGVVSGMMRQPAGIEVLLDRAPGSASTPSRRAVIHAGATEKVWQQVAADGGLPPLAGLPPEVLLAPRAAIAWDERDPAAAMLVPPATEPAWMRFPAGGDRIERSAVRALADALAASPETGVDEPLRRLATDPRSENRMIAAATLALLGDYRELVTLLAAERPLSLNETQWTTLEQMAVPLALARGENSAAALAEAFRVAGPPGKGDTLMACARGFSDDELAAGGDALLVGALGDGSLAVRRSAIRRLVEIVQPDERHRSTYRADRPDTLRADGIAWWKTQLEQGRIRRGGEPPAAAPAALRDRGDE